MNQLKNSLKISQENESKYIKELEVVWKKFNEKDIEIAKLNNEKTRIEENLKQLETIKSKNLAIVDDKKKLEVKISELEFKLEEILADNVFNFLFLMIIF